MSRLVKLRRGHAPGHVRDMFMGAAFAFMDWEDGTPEPTVTFEVNYQPQTVTLSKACGLLWQCNDIVPGQIFEWLRDDHGLDIKRQTYSACAQAMLRAVRERLAAEADSTEQHTISAPTLSL